MIQKHVRVPGDDDPHRCSHGHPLTSVVSHTSFLLDHRCWLAMRAATSEEMARVSSLRVAGGQRVPSLSPPGISRGDPQFFKNNLLVDNFSQFFDLKKMISTHTLKKGIFVKKIAQIRQISTTGFSR